MSADLGLHLRFDDNETLLDRLYDTQIIDSVRQSLFWAVYAANV